MPMPDVRQNFIHGWQVCAIAPGQVGQAGDLTADLDWLDAPKLGPAADVLRQLGQWSLDGEAKRFDAQDWWYRLCFDLQDGDAGCDHVLGLDGLATVAEVWLNGESVLVSTNMFLAHRVVVTPHLKPKGNQLVMVFRSLDKALTQRRPRPRWRAPMIENQQLRWFRTTVLGRTPGWSPPAAVVGPWRGVWLSAKPLAQVDGLVLRPTVTGGVGRLALSCAILSQPGQQVDSAELCLERGGVSYSVALTQSDATWSGCLQVDEVDLWWPHTHGEPALYAAGLRLSVLGEAPPVWLSLGSVGFRTVDIDRREGGFSISVNGVPVFARGACWTPLDPVTLDAASELEYARALSQVRSAGMNMLRVGGTMAYEADAFYDQCDQQGIMVWQEFMFANMDYPQDAEFVEAVTLEARQQMQRWQARPALTVLCGNSEVEQQAAMFGATRDLWAPALFHETLAREAANTCPDVPYWPSSACDGAFPHQGDVGTTSYYGVGAYQRDPDDARRANLQFATECLAFSNVPESAAMARMPGGLALRVHHPAWKSRAPRDLGAGWDFEDVRDHYLALLFGVDPAKLRYSDHDRYLTLSRVASGEVMAGAFAEWRRSASSCHGAMIWFLRDLWPGAGWGVVDSLGQPKAPYYYLKRTLQAVSVAVSDEGGNGLYAHVANDGAQVLHGEVEVTAWRHGHVQVGQGRRAIEVPPHGAQSWSLMAWFDWFVDWSWSYRFGPVSAQVLSVKLISQQGDVLAQAFAFPAGLALPMERDLVLQAKARAIGSGQFEVTVSTVNFAQSVHFDVDGCVPDDAYFHLGPGDVRCVVLRAHDLLKASLSGCVRAINSDTVATIQMDRGAA
ncbi:MAG: glycoside hydrolase family 2 protein [Aquabacterium sp.]|nr:glycoside hydrolase family 2 protein [Aquabacterium sp.]